MHKNTNYKNDKPTTKWQNFKRKKHETAPKRQIYYVERNQLQSDECYKKQLSDCKHNYTEPRHREALRSGSFWTNHSVRRLVQKYKRYHVHNIVLTSNS